MFVENVDLRSPKMSEDMKKELRRRLNCNKTSDDKVAAMLSFLEKKEIPLDTERLYRSFYKLKEKYPEFLKEFVFSRNDVYPFSSLLWRILFRLQNAGVISTVNPDFKRCIISDESKAYIRKNILPIFELAEQKKLEEMARIFEKSMSIET
jgi:hypothetical protein